MGELRVIEPKVEYAQQIMDYRQAILDAGEPLVGCGGLEEAEDYEDWLRRNHRMVQGGPLIYLALRKVDRRIVGMAEYWPIQTTEVLLGGGALRFSIHPRERGRGHATEMVERVLGRCWELGSQRLTVLCDSDNGAALKVIEANGGVPASPKWLGPADGRRAYYLYTKEIEEAEEDVDFDWFTEHWYRPGRKPGDYRDQDP